MSLKGTVFYPTSAISAGVLGGLTHYSPKLCTHNVTKVSNDKHETKPLPVLCVGVQRPHKTRSTTSDFSRFWNPYATKRHEWVKRVNRVIIVEIVRNF